jgi:hypothetical protein
LILASLALLVAAAPVLAQRTKVISREQTIRRSVQAGEELRVFTYARWNHDCKPGSPPRIELRARPAHGTASLRPGSSTVRQIRDGEADCTGYTYPGTAVWYVSAPGFHGTDRFDWEIYGENGNSHDTAVIDVK